MFEDGEREREREQDRENVSDWQKQKQNWGKKRTANTTEPLEIRLRNVNRTAYAQYKIPFPSRLEFTQ